MAIIKLTDFANEKTKYYINTKNIDGFYIEDEHGAVTDVCTVGNSFRVKETPEEILALIKEEIGLDNKLCECFMGFDKEWISKEAKDKGLTFKECLFFLYFFNTISITPQDREFKAGVEMYKKFAKATVKALELIKEAKTSKFKFNDGDQFYPRPECYNPNVQDIIDKAHANEILMREKDPTYGR